MANLYPYLPGFLLGYGVFMLAMLSPGPNILTIMGTSMSVSRSAGMSLAFGTAIGSLCWAILAVMGLSAIIANYAWVLVVIKIAGGAFLLWLAYKSFIAASKTHDISASALIGKRSLWRYALRGFTVQMTNPKAAIFWVATMSLVFQDGAPFWVMMLFGLGTFVLSLVLHQVYAIAFSTKVMVKAYSSARRPIQYALGSFFTFAGFKLLLSRT